MRYYKINESSFSDHSKKVERERERSVLGVQNSKTATELLETFSEIFYMLVSLKL